jgi:hypothetical protein
MLGCTHAVNPDRHAIAVRNSASQARHMTSHAGVNPRRNAANVRGVVSASQSSDSRALSNQHDRDNRRSKGDGF